MHRVHIDATMRLSHAALRSMVARDDGRDHQCLIGGGVSCGVPRTSATAPPRRGSMRSPKDSTWN